MAAVIEFQNVTKVFNAGQTAVDNVTLQVQSGTAVACLGPNGAGKSTSISMMLGLLKPTSGTVKLFGGNPESLHLHQRLGVMLQGVSVLDRLTVRETLNLVRSYFANPFPIAGLLKVASLENEADKLSTKLSGGQMRRLQFALSLAGNPDVLFLDEPTVGMDFSSKQIFWQELRRFITEGKTLLLTTHDLHEADSMADRVVVIDHGKIIADDTPEQLKMMYAGRQVSFVLGGDMPHEVINQLPGVVSFREEGRQIIIRTSNSDELITQVIKQDWGISDIQIFGGGLEDAYVRLIGEKEDKE
ncbi:ABC transporter ATP-binding protein [Desulfosporosinus sp. OT]|uniref:ABC transporter ATP-binding protein n=1 Tax=Desulfosporosinus sp. OT TaxID=913865 RepID=UPI000223AF2C|nr:ABC transporter ATP-binding protein [Desulfosporosinus sp. OT]EGW38864.1 ABC transporter family protein [Desulfosporosinus sp. OT]